MWMHVIDKDTIFLLYALIELYLFLSSYIICRIFLWKIFKLFMYGIRTNIISQNLIRGIFIVDVCHRWHLWIYIVLDLNNGQFWLILDIGRVYMILSIYGFFNIGCFHVDACNRKIQYTSMSPYFNIAFFVDAFFR